MARFDLHRRKGTPGYLLEVQSDHMYALPSRMVVPLLPPTAALPAIRDLGRPIGNLLSQADDITRALNILLTGF